MLFRIRRCNPINIDEPYKSYLQSIEQEWRESVKESYPLFRDIQIDWSFKDKMDSLWTIKSSHEEGLKIQLLTNPKKLDKQIKKLSKFFKIEFVDFKKSFYIYLLFLSFYTLLEAPFSIVDRKNIHKSIFKGIKLAEPDLYEYEAVQSLEYIHMLIKEFISLNRLFIENNERNEKWFHNEVIMIPYYIALEKSLATVNYITIIWYINTILYCNEKGLELIENKLMDEVFVVASRLIKRTIDKKEVINLPNRLNEYFNENKKVKREKNRYSQYLKFQFEGKFRYDSIIRLVEVLTPFIDHRFVLMDYKSSLNVDGIYHDLFDTFTLQEKAIFVKSIINESKITDPVSSSDDSIPIEFKLIHEYYKENRPKLVLLGDEGFNQNFTQKGNYRLKLKKIYIFSLFEVNKLDLNKIFSFQIKYGVPVLVPINNEKFYYYEYEVKYEEKRKIRYRRISKYFKIPDILEIYLDNTGSMYFEEDTDHLGFNDGSRHDISISVIYALILELYRASLKQKKNCQVKIHSFSESQVSTDLLPIEDFVNGSNKFLEILYNPKNGYNFENLNINDDDKHKNKRKVIIIITDGDLVIEGRTEREASKMKYLAREPLTQIILFEMEQQFSLGKKLNDDQFVIQHSVKNKEHMFMKGIEIILENTT